MSVPDPNAGDATLPAQETAPGAGASAASMALPRRGEALGRYIILKQLGAGGMGVVFEAFDPELERKVALKVLYPDARDDDATSAGKARVLREARAIAKLSHPNVITVFDVGTVDGQVFLAMELIDGRSLTRWLQDESPSREEILRVFEDAGRGLAAAHDAGLVHRDFKPDNALVDQHGRVVVLDFGLAKPAATAAEPDGSSTAPQEDGPPGPERGPTDATSQADGRSAYMGTPAFMAPEQHLGKEVDARADQFAFCVTLYRALYGHHPFGGDNLVSLATNVLEGNVRPVSAGSKAPRWVHPILVRGLAVDPEARWPSMQALLEALSHDPSRRRRRVLVAAIATVVVLGTAGVVWLDEQRRVESCRDNEDELVGVWDPQQRRRAQAHYGASGVEQDQEAFRLLDARLVAYRDEWLRIHERSCIDEPRYAAHQRACLDEARTYLSAGSTLLVDLGSDKLFRDAMAYFPNSLPEVELCDAQEKLEDLFPLPPPGPVRQEVFEVRATLARAEALANAEQVAQGLALSQDAVERSRSLNYEPVIAEALEVFGAVQWTNGDLEAAEHTLWASIAAAQRAQHQRIEAEAWTRQTFLVGRELGRPREALRWVPVAEAAVELAQSRAQEAAFEGNRGAIHFSLAQWDEAETHFKTALSIAQDVRGPDALGIDSYLNNLGSLEGARGNTKKAIGYFERAMSIVEPALGRDHTEVAFVLNNLGSAYADLGEFERAEELLLRSLAIRERSLPQGHVDIAKSLHGLATIYAASGRYTRSIELNERALNIYRKALGADSYEAANVHASLAWAMRSVERHDEALAHAHKAVDISKGSLGLDHEATITALRQLALSGLAAGQHDVALDASRQALDVLRDGEADADEIAAASLTVAKAHRARDQPAAARDVLRTALEQPGVSAPVADELRQALEQ